MNMTVTDMVATLAEPAQRPKTYYTEVIAWLPIRTFDGHWVWLQHVWKITVGNAKPFYSTDIISW